MKRLSSQLIFCSPHKILRNTVIEQNEKGEIIRFIDLQTQQAETAQTLFFDGIISSGVVSLKTQLSASEINESKSNFEYIDVSEHMPTKITLQTQKPFVIDFGTNDIATINKVLKINYALFSSLNAFDIICACSYQPIQMLNLPKRIKPSEHPDLILWQGFDLQAKKITERISILAL